MYIFWYQVNTSLLKRTESTGHQLTGAFGSSSASSHLFERQRENPLFINFISDFAEA